MTLLIDLLTLYFWIGVVGLLLLLNRIARFFELTTSVPSYYHLFLVPAAFILAGLARYLLAGTRVAGDALGDIFFFLGGVSLMLVAYNLLKLMTGGRR